MTNPPSDEFFRALKARDYDAAIALVCSHPQIVGSRTGLIFGGQAGNPEDFAGKTHCVLTAAANEGAIEVVKALLEAGADVNDTGMFGETALHTACWYGHADIAELLIQNGASIDAREREFDSTPMGYAIAGSIEGAWCGEHDQVGCIRLLVQAGAPLEVGTIQALAKEGPFTGPFKTYLHEQGVLLD